MTVRRVVRIASVAAATLAAAACTSTGSGTPSQTAISTGGPHAPTTITVWTFNHLPNEVDAFGKALAALKAKYPWLTVTFVSNKDDAAYAKAIAAGNPPDVFISAAPDNVGKFCHDGTVSDLTPLLKASGLDPTTVFPAATLGYTRAEGKQCALPLLTDVYALYYSKKAFAEAGITSPPRTLSELTADAKKLTVRAADGSITRFGFVPRSDYNLNTYIYGGVYSGSTLYDAGGKSTLASDPKWAALLKWDNELNSFYGKDNVDRFVGTYNDHTDDAGNALLTGATAMELDGEWHIGEAKDGAPGFDYGVAPFPVLDEAASTYGGGVSVGTVIYLSSAGKHQSEAFFAAEQLATDTTFLTSLADAVSNVPTTFDSLQAWGSAHEPHWASMIAIFNNANSRYAPPTPAGAEDQAVWSTFVADYEVGKVPDLTAGLRATAAKVDEVIAQASS